MLPAGYTPADSGGIFCYCDTKRGSRTRLTRAVELSSADRMRELEKLETGQWVATRGRRQDIPFIGVAKAGGWRTSLPASCVDKIESTWGELMTTLGYGLASNKQATV